MRNNSRDWCQIYGHRDIAAEHAAAVKRIRREQRVSKYKFIGVTLLYATTAIGLCLWAVMRS